MTDLLYIGVITTFFVLALGYVGFCASLNKKESDE